MWIGITIVFAVLKLIINLHTTNLTRQKKKQLFCVMYGKKTSEREKEEKTTPIQWKLKRITLFKMCYWLCAFVSITVNSQYVFLLLLSICFPFLRSFGKKRWFVVRSLIVSMTLSSIQHSLKLFSSIHTITFQMA